MGVRRVRGRALHALRLQPALAVSTDTIVCLNCGRELRQLTNTHLATHGLTAESYRETWGYPRHEGLVCGDLQAFFRARTIRTQLAARIRRRRLNRSAFRGQRQRLVAIQRRVAATDYAARERRRAVHPREKPVDVRLLQEMRDTGLSLRAIGARVGCSVTTVARKLGRRFPSDYRAKYRERL